MAIQDVTTAVLWQRLSAERMAPYLAAAGGDRARALRLYEWNIAISGALFESIGSMEVLLRNALHQHLTAYHATTSRPGEWYDDPARVLTERAREDIAAARERVRDRGCTETPGRVVAELSFGFWRFLLAKTYEHTLWTPALAAAFPLLKPLRRTSIHQPLCRLNELRNRIAHHEPIHARRLTLDYRDLLTVAAAICADTARWIDRTSRVNLTLTLRP
ncbi:MAG TPA: hypothetical protein VFQ85_15475 [Mycobacteriales bacterium]|jgi:hypothetical protein|nr:hypothetical protein [Mycobacteriales bacterium]